ncbi:HTH-type transcriptional regulator CdhR [Stieleria neptunia]|uniref:HTH-type transcriptional regulator CdhR n=1 Tax=Stieleria neptunia TaxID=2527979 RepID=A0A518HND0_9BACT|nr:HTH-type transcriptional regulator CdhR [Stieleria neptunia]
MRTERKPHPVAGACDRDVTSIDVKVLSKLFDSAPDAAFFVKDADGRYVAVNESLVKRHGFRSKSDVIGKQPRDICQGEFGQVPSKQDEKVLRTGRPLIEHLEMQWDRPLNPVWCLTTKLPIHDSDGNVVGLIGFSRDVRVSIPTEEIPTAFAIALEEFERTLDAAVTPAWLAQRSRLTTQKLARFTRRIFDLTPTQLIAKIRIAAASRLLRSTNKPIVEIALACGFCDHSAFTRAFRRATGVTPSVFRKQR